MELWHILPMFALEPLHDHLGEVSAEHAAAILEALLWRDLAYHAENMPRDQAKKLAADFVNEHNDTGAQFLSNADWRVFHEQPNGFSWTGLTKATFDGGLIVVHRPFASCVWVEDED
jgi:hypothetical protein